MEKIIQFKTELIHGKNKYNSAQSNQVRQEHRIDIKGMDTVPSRFNT